MIRKKHSSAKKSSWYKNDEHTKKKQKKEGGQGPRPHQVSYSCGLVLPLETSQNTPKKSPPNTPTKSLQKMKIRKNSTKKFSPLISRCSPFAYVPTKTSSESEPLELFPGLVFCYSNSSPIYLFAMFEATIPF